MLGGVPAGSDDQIGARSAEPRSQPNGCHTSRPWANTIERNFPERNRIIAHDGSEVGMQCDHEQRLAARSTQGRDPNRGLLRAYPENRNSAGPTRTVCGPTDR